MSSATPRASRSRLDQALALQELSEAQDITDEVAAYQQLEQLVSERTREIERQRRELAALYQADEYLHQHLHLNQVLEALVVVVKDIFQADKVGVFVWDERRGRIEVRASHGFAPDTLRLMSFRPGEGVAGRVFQSGQLVVIEDFQTEHSVGRVIADREGIRSMLSVPITIGGQVFGVFGVNYLYPRPFNDHEKRLFLALAQRAALALQNAQLFEQSQHAAILEERQRLARELHDSVTQSLYSLTLLAEAGRRLARSGDTERVETYLGRLGETAQQALKEMRLLVYELRPLELEREGLIGALQQRLDTVEKRAGVKANIRVEGDVDLPAAVESELYRVASEALNNALKHAAATTLTITLRAHVDGVEMVIADNGRGFAPADLADRGGLGLTSMRERVERLGGSFTLLSTPEAGTQVIARVESGEAP